MKAGIVMLAVTAVTLTLRVLAANNDFWFDEIWSWNLALQIEHPAEIISKLHHDNNHPLNTFWLYVAGIESPSWLYRLPSVICGTLAVVLAGAGRLRTTPVETWLIWLLMGTSFFGVQYSSEARGYGYLLLMVVAGLRLVEFGWGNANRPMFASGLLFGFVCCLGFLSHATFLMAFLAFGSYSLARIIADRKNFGMPAIGKLVLWYAMPGLFFLGLWSAFFSRMKIGGGDSAGVLNAILQTASLFIGGPEQGIWFVLCATMTLAIGVSGCIQLTSQKDLLAVLYLVGVVFAPALFLVVLKPDPVYPRYFLVPVVLGLFLFARTFAGLLAARGTVRIVASCGLIMMTAANLYHVSELILVGRGGYSESLVLMSNETSGPSMTIAGDHDFRISMILDFHHRRLPELKPADYLPEGRWPQTGPEWVILHGSQTGFNPPETINDQVGNIYEQREIYTHAGLSGFDWAIYRNTNRPVTGAF